MSSIDELRLDDLPGGELTIEQDEMRDDKDAMFQAAASRRGEPMIRTQNSPWASKDLRVLNEGDLLEAFSPCYRKAKVLRAMPGSVIVECSVMRNQQVWPKGATRPVDNWVKSVWRESWAVRPEEYEDPNDPRRKWIEYHCTVTEERGRSQAERMASLLTGSRVEVARDDHPETYFGGPDEWEPEEQPPVDMVSGQPTGGVMSPQAPATQEKLVEPAPEPEPQTKLPKYTEAVKMATDAGVDVSDIHGTGSIPKILERIAEAQTA